MIQSVIFDMDGLMIDSEPLWREAEIKVFNTVGIELNETLCRETTGRRTDEVVEHWYKRFPWQNKLKKELDKELVDAAASFISGKGELLPGVIHALQFFSKKGLKLALASSSQYKLINLVIDKFELRNFFSVIYSAEEEKFGKPHPAVYLTTAKKLTTDPKNCVAIEDSVNGVLSAHAANMKVIAVPDKENVSNPKFSIAQVKISSLLEINEGILSELEKSPNHLLSP